MNKNKYINFIDLKSRYLDEKNQLLKIIDRVLKSGNLILSEENENLERKICKYLDSNYCLTLNSGTDALMLALWAAGVKKGDEVITSTISFIATAASIAHIGAIPVFVDAKDDLNIDEDLIEKKITKKTKAIIPVHWTGRMCDMKKIKKIAKKYKLIIIEDAAQAIGSTYFKKKPGYYSDFATFSTHPLKILNAIGDGGFLTTNNKNYYEAIKKYRNHGMISRDNYELYGVNSRLDSIHAAVINYRLDRVNEIIKKRQNNIELYRKNIKSKYFKIIDCKNYEYNSFTMFVSLAEKRDDLKKYLAKNNIETLIYYGTPLHLQTASKYLGYHRGDFPNAEMLCNKVISLPFHQNITKNQIKYISEKINKFYS
jgi:dTDP-4-amino-4,6-dideoxygalactose transaminase